jgi:alkylation response protein AidB-like acyl-CoA dehydrogenase
MTATQASQAGGRTSHGRTSPGQADYGPAAERLREEVRQWLEASAPASLAGVAVPRKPEGQLARDLRDWTDTMARARLVCVSWPREYGGRGASAVEVAVIEEEFRRARMPRMTRGMGETLVGPSIIAHGTDEQRAYFLPRILDGTDRYCQGFSEPGAGSDLAGLATRGVVDGDEVAVTGQKVWTSWFWDATMLFCLCRTDPDAPRHRGLSYVLLPVTAPGGGPNGIEFRPIRQLTGQSHFAETFLDGSRAPLFNVIGGLGNGWRVAMTTLGNERGGRAATRHAMFEEQFWKVVAEARRRGKAGDPLTRQLLASAWTQVEIMRIQAGELLSSLITGTDPGRSAAASLHKVMWSEYQQRLAAQVMDLLGPGSVIVGPGYELDEWQQVFLTSRSDTIWGGTAEIQRNIIGERLLGLPREPR